MKIPDKFTGKWKIYHMDQRDTDYIDMEVPGHITIDKDGMGHFQFGLVTGKIDCKFEKYNGDERIELPLSTMKCCRMPLSGICR